MDRFSCPICKTTLSQEPPVATVEVVPIDSPVNLIDVPCCNSICGHLAHSKCLLRSLEEDPAAGCPTCQRQILKEELYPIRPPLEAAAPSGSAPPNGSGDTPRGAESSSTLESRTRTASTAFGISNNSEPKQPRTSDAASSTGASGPRPTDSSSGTSGSPPSGSPPPPPRPTTQALVELLYSYGVDLRAVFTPEICRQCDEQLQRIEQAIEDAGINTQEIVANAMRIRARIERLRDQFESSDPQQQQQLLERVTAALVDAFLDVDSNRIRDELADLESDLANMVAWWDRQNF